MRCFIVCCLAALAACQSFTYASHLRQDKILEYHYTAVVRVGARDGLPESSIRLSTLLKITGDSGQKYFIQCSDVKFEELNGLNGKDNYVPLTRLMSRIASEFSKPLGFSYDRGHVSHITAPAGISNTVLNIYRGFLETFTMTFKSDLSSYELEEASIYGICPSHYVKSRDVHTGVVTLKRVVDLTRCSHKAEAITGLASAVPNQLTKMVGMSHLSQVSYTYQLEEREGHQVITQASAKEQQFASPFNIMSGHFRLQAEKTLTLIKILDKYSNVVCDDMVYVGELMYKFDNIHQDIPVVMQERDRLVLRAQLLLEKLANGNHSSIPKEANENSLKLYQIYRLMSLGDVDSLWKRNGKLPATRSWLLSTLPESADPKMMNFIVARFQAADLKPTEAAQLFLVAANHAVASRELVEKAKELLKLPFTRSSPMLLKTVILAYGSLIHKLCVYQRPCAAGDIEPLLEIAKVGLSVAHYSEDLVITSLKAMGNAGYPAGLKFVRTLFYSPLPGRVVTPRIRFSAIQSLRLIADVDPVGVRDVARDLAINVRISPGLRMLAIKQLLETNPPNSVVTMLTSHLLIEQDQSVGIFAYSLLRSISKSSTPNNRFLAVYAGAAVAVLRPKYHDISSEYNNVNSIDWFSNGLLVGEAASYFIINAMKGKIPDNIILSSQMLLLGRVLPQLEAGLDLKDLKELLSSVDSNSLSSLLERWNNSSSDRVILSIYSQLFGQELFWTEVTKQSINDILMGLTDLFMKGGKIQATKAFMLYEARSIQPTCVGLPWEFTKIYHSISKLLVSADPAISPLHAKRTVLLRTTGSLNLKKHIWTFFGVNTELFQCAAELKTKVSVEIPWEIRVKLGLDDKIFSIDVPVPKETIKVFELESQVRAIFRTVGSEDKEIEMFPGVVNDQQSDLGCSATGYGFKLCMSSVRAGTLNQFNELASIFFGSRHVLIKIVPDQERIGDSIRLEVNLDPKKVKEIIEPSDNSGEIEPLFYHENNMTEPNCTAIPMLAVKLVLVSGNKDVAGYSLHLYRWENRPISQLSWLIIQVGSPDHFKICIDTRIDNITSAELHARFGPQCNPFKVSLITAAHPAPGFLTALSVTLKWGKVPELWIAMAEQYGDLVPGFMVMKGFRKYNTINGAQQIVAHMSPTIHRELNVVLEFPKYTYEKNGIQLPILVRQTEDEEEITRETEEIRI